MFPGQPASALNRSDNEFQLRRSVLASRGRAPNRAREGSAAGKLVDASAGEIADALADRRIRHAEHRTEITPERRAALERPERRRSRIDRREEPTDTKPLLERHMPDDQPVVMPLGVVVPAECV